MKQVLKRQQIVQRYMTIVPVIVVTIALQLSGCAKPKPCDCEVPRACCRGLVPQCAACEEGLTLEAWLKKTCPNGDTDAHYGGWDEATQKAIWICENKAREKIQISD
jgi:hypothetical protein